MEDLKQEIYWKDWLDGIRELKKNKEVIPIDAQLDSSWLITPGYNGIKINVLQSLLNLEKYGKWDESQIVYEEIEPYISISNLNPAPVYFGSPKKPMVSLMINVAWGNEYLTGLLNILKQKDVKASFFLEGKWTGKFPLLAGKIREDDHEIGNHAYSHPDMKSITLKDIREELRRTNEAIEKELGVKPVLFTPPSGEFDERVVYLAAQEVMYTVLSTIDTVDWRRPDPRDIEEKIRLKLRNGAIILMHPTESSLMALEGMINIIRERGYKLGTVSQLLSTKRVDTGSSWIFK